MSIGRYVLTPTIFKTLRGLSAGSGEIQLAMQLTYMLSGDLLELSFLTDGGLIVDQWTVL